MTLTNEAEARDWLAQLPGVDAAAWGRLELLATLLAQENTRQNLVSAASLGAVWLRHIVDSAQLLRLVPRETFADASAQWLDLGTGAGFPGLVIAALRPEMPVAMVESRAKRIDWLERARLAMALPHARVIGARLEAVPSFPAAVISARAFAPLENILSLSARFSTARSLYLLPKGRSARQELAALPTGRRGFGGKFHVEPSLTDPDAGIVVGHLTTPGKKP